MSRVWKLIRALAVVPSAAKVVIRTAYFLPGFSGSSENGAVPSTAKWLFEHCRWFG